MTSDERIQELVEKIFQLSTEDQTELMQQLVAANAEPDFLDDQS